MPGRAKRLRSAHRIPVMHTNRPKSQYAANGFVACVAVVLVLQLSGCGPPSDGAPIPVTDISYWTLPPEGASLPAPRGLFAAENGELYVLDDAGRVIVLDFDGDVLRQWEMPEHEVGRPEGVCRFHDGRIAVADTHYDRIVFFDDRGEVVGMQGEHGSQPGQFVYPVAITQDALENFYVAEYGDKNRVQKFDVDGNFLLEFGEQGTEIGQFQRPSGVAWVDGHVYVVDAFNNRIQVFSDEGVFARVLGNLEDAVDLDYPYDISAAADGALYVVEYRAGRVTHVDTNGNLLGRFGVSGRDRGQFLTPWGLTVTNDQQILVADTGNRRIVQLRLE